MSWEITGTPLDSGSFTPLSANDVLYDFDGPRIFTAQLMQREVLVYQCDEGDAACRYVVVPVAALMIDDLKDGRLTVREALAQPWLWLFEQSNQGELLAVWQLDTLDAIPAGRLPSPGTMLLPSLMPLLTVKMVGPELKRGEIPAGVVTRAINGTTSALKTLVDAVSDAEDKSGRPTDRIRSFYNLRVQRLAYGSFEVAFREPEAPDAAGTGRSSERDGRFGSPGRSGRLSQ